MLPTGSCPPSRGEALLALSQDISALLSLTYESASSIVHDTYHSALGLVGLGEWYWSKRDFRTKGESGRGHAVVVVGANENIGQSLTLHLAKSGYTVFPFVPLPSPSSPPTSGALSNLLLTWASIQKRLRAKSPAHPGQVVPVIVDSEGVAQDLEPHLRGELDRPHPKDKRKTDEFDYGTAEPDEDGPPAEGRFGHAGETVRAYCRENELDLLSIVFVPRKPKLRPIKVPLWMPRPATPLLRKSDLKSQGPLDQRVPRRAPQNDSPLDVDVLTAKLSPSFTSFLPNHLSPSALTLTDESVLLSLYRSNVLDPLCVIRELSEFMALYHALGKGRTRIVFVNGSAGGGALAGGSYAGTGGGLGITEIDPYERHQVYEDRVRLHGALSMIAAARKEAAKVMRAELDVLGIQVCEVVTGPMVHRTRSLSSHTRQASEDYIVAEEAKKRSYDEGQELQYKPEDVPGWVVFPIGMRRNFGAILSSRFAHLAALWAVDDALLYSSVKRAIEDRYPRQLIRAGLSPIVDDWTDLPALRVVKEWGWWMLGRLITLGFWLYSVRAELMSIVDFLTLSTYHVYLELFKMADYCALHIPSWAMWRLVALGNVVYLRVARFVSGLRGVVGK